MESIGARQRLLAARCRPSRLPQPLALSSRPAASAAPAASGSDPAASRPGRQRRPPPAASRPDELSANNVRLMLPAVDVGALAVSLLPASSPPPAPRRCLLPHTPPPPSLPPPPPPPPSSSPLWPTPAGCYNLVSRGKQEEPQNMARSRRTTDETSRIDSKRSMTCDVFSDLTKLPRRRPLLGNHGRSSRQTSTAAVRPSRRD